MVFIASFSLLGLAFFIFGFGAAAYEESDCRDSFCVIGNDVATVVTYFGLKLSEIIKLNFIILLLFSLTINSLIITAVFSFAQFVLRKIKSTNSK